MKSKEKNQLREGLKLDKKLKNGFYHFLYEKNIDWAIILGLVLLTLPYIASSSWYFLSIKSAFFILIVYLVVRYLKTWNSLRQYKVILDQWEKLKKEKITKEVVKNTDFESAIETIDNVGNELKTIKQKLEKKADQYKDFEEYVKYDQVDFIEMEEVINKNPKNDFNAMLISMAVLIGILHLRAIPKEESKNYKRLLYLLLTAFLFFIVYTIENIIIKN